MKTPLGTEVDLDQATLCWPGTPLPSAKGAQQPPLFLAHVYYMAMVAHLSYC